MNIAIQESYFPWSDFKEVITFVVELSHNWLKEPSMTNPEGDERQQKFNNIHPY